MASAEQHTVSQRHRKIKMTAWREAMRSSKAMQLSDGNRVLSTLCGLASSAGARLFLQSTQTQRRSRHNGTSCRLPCQVQKATVPTMNLHLDSLLLYGIENPHGNITVLYCPSWNTKCSAHCKSVAYRKSCRMVKYSFYILFITSSTCLCKVI